MKLAAQKAELSECPYASDDAKQILGAASEPPVKGVAIGAESSVKLGEETVLYRHEKTFVNQTALAVNINDTDDPAEAEQTLGAIKDYVLERVGEVLMIDAVSVTQKGTDAAAFAACAKKAHELTGKPLVLRSADPAALIAAAEAVKGSRSVLASATPETADQLWPVAKENGHVLAVTGDSLNDVALTTAKIKDAGFNDLILEFKTHSLAEQFQTNSLARRVALRDSVKSVGYASVKFIECEDLMDITVDAVTEISKYGGLCVLPVFDKALLSSLMTLRLNIYTDPQKPIQVEPKLYPVGEPAEDAPVFLTTNFSLTYFIVSGEIENSGLNAWLLVPECEGMSVLTAWAAGKFSGASIGKFAKEITLDESIKSRTLVIPGYVAQISGELEESMPGWDIVVGPQEASDIESFVKAKFG